MLEMKMRRIPMISNPRFMARMLVAFVLLTAIGVLAGGSARAQSQLSTENVRQAETEAGNLIADAVRAATSADIVFLPAAAFKQRATTMRPASPDAIATLLETPADTLVILTLRGTQVLAALERSVSFAPQPSSGFLQVSGLRFTFDGKAAGGRRVQSVSLNGAPLDAARMYKVATTLPLANGQQGYFQIWEKEQIAAKTNRTLADALVEFARTRGGSLSGSVEGRIATVAK